ncbi:MAG: hypothetical protein KAT34_01750 [Candidatus Aminicenantes bacterium]|nr:hypothetical protein [Candidatus Aminicenantes bacterium]
MNKIRILFIVLVLIIFIVSLVIFTDINVPVEPEIDRISEFQITKISGNGAIYADKKPMKAENMSQLNVVDVREMHHSDEMYIKADAQTSLEFYFFGTSFTALPGSYIHYQPKIKELCLYNGEYYWKREIKEKNFNISIAVEDNTDAERKQMMIRLPDSGRLKITGDIIKIWNYTGNLVFNYDNREYGLKSNQALQVKDQKVDVLDILPPPDFITPDDKVIAVNKPADSFVKFSWRTVIGTNDYILRFYSSDLMENILKEMIIPDTGKTINILTFGVNEFFWQVFPYDSKNEREGTPSKIGSIKIIGSISDDERVPERPELIITSLSASGNMVLIKGEADEECRLFINDKPVLINMDGTFYETLTYDKIGQKTITFKLVAPTEMETVITRTVTIFDE